MQALSMIRQSAPPPFVKIYTPVNRYLGIYSFCDYCIFIHFSMHRIHSTFLGGKYGDFYIIDQLIRANKL